MCDRSIYTFFYIFQPSIYARKCGAFYSLNERWVQWVYRRAVPVGLQNFYIKTFFFLDILLRFLDSVQECEKTPVSVKTGRTTIFQAQISLCIYGGMNASIKYSWYSSTYLKRTIIHYNNVWIVIWWKVGLVGRSSLSTPRFTTRIYSQKKKNIRCIVCLAFLRLHFVPGTAMFLFVKLFMHIHFLYIFFPFAVENDERSYNFYVGILYKNLRYLHSIHKGYFS